MMVGAMPAVQATGLSALTLAIVLGMVVGNTFYPRIAAPAAAGVGFSKQRLLRIGVVLYGLRLTVQDIGHVGLAGVAIDAVVIASTFGLACLLGTRWLGMERRVAMLVGAGSAICGAAAVMATAPVVKARAEQVTVAVATVVVFGTLAIFLYPALHAWAPLRDFVGGSGHGFGVYAGSTIHEVAQVVAVGDALGPQAADAAVIAKMVRVMLLAPFLLLLSAWLARREQGSAHAGEGGASGMVVPWFAFGFVAVVLLNSLQILPAAMVQGLIFLDTVLLAMAMGALGVSTHLASIRQAGAKPLLLALVLFVWLVGGGAVINRLGQMLLGG